MIIKPTVTDLLEIANNRFDCVPVPGYRGKSLQPLAPLVDMSNYNHT